ncbi:hypothetical protein B0T19DRAFT_443702 [Cercophora scortea]|uniref:Uncharacterized protein n=1 Tax=Cercophora scortea TaxID=314031 RepID=A0AAE0IFM4_9PEZI|nr:hypothetical protein B0T19DRAFT_443702 [Cercophora scortea]
MTLSSSGDRHRARLHQIAAGWGVTNPPPLPPLIPPGQVSTPRTAQDDAAAEEQLKRRRINANPEGNSQGGIKRAFTTTKKTWEPKEIFDALDAHVSNYGDPGVAEAFISKLLSAGGNLNVPNAKKSGLLNRRKSTEFMQPSRVLHKAIENRHTDMVAVLVPYADIERLNTALPFAIRAGDLRILQMLLGAGARARDDQDALDAFRQMCIMGGRADLVGLILQSDGRPKPGWISMSLVDAARKGCLDTVLRLSRSTADGNHNNGEAIKTAIGLGRVDIVLAILTGMNPPTPGGQALRESFAHLFQHPSIGPNEKMALAEALLCAGASGDPVSVALSQACSSGFYDLVDLLISYSPTSIEFQDAAILREAISRGQSSLVQLLLNERVPLSPIYAAECVEHIPKTIAPEDRHAFLSILLRKGAKGAPINDALIDAVHAIDFQSVELLLTPHFPAPLPVAGHNNRQGPNGMVYDRHEMASVDHKNGLALNQAVMAGNLPMVKLLLTGRPSPEILALVFPQVTNLQAPADRYHMAECFLSAGVSGPCVSAALEEAIKQEPPHRDGNFVSLLLRHNADVNFNDGAGILLAVSQQDLGLLGNLLRRRPSPQAADAAITKALIANDKRIRYEMVRLLIEAGAGREGIAISRALVQLLPVKPVDTQLVSLLLEQGRADANYDQGASVILAVNDRDPAILELVLQHGRPNAGALFRGLDILSEMPTNPAKVHKVDAILRRTKDKDLLNTTLFKEVKTVLGSPPDKRNFAVIKLLLSAGADVNSHKAGALAMAVKGVDSALTDLLFTSHIASASLVTALPQSLNIQDPMDRLSFTQRLIDAGAPSKETNRALIYAITTHPNDLPLHSILAAHAESTDGEALRMAVKHQNPDVVDIILAKTPRMYTAPVLEAAFQEATTINDKEKRAIICTTLLKKGVSGQIVSDALLAASADGDLALGTALLSHGASIDHQEGQAVVEACGAGSSDVLRMLLAGKAETSSQTLLKGFQAATLQGDLIKRADVFRQLLEKGITGEPVDSQLVSAAKFGDDGEGLVRLLLEFGADVNYNGGEAIWNATRSATMGSLKLMLGVDTAGDRQTKPNTATLLKALKASRKLDRDPRYQVIEWLFHAGLPPSEEIHIALHRAVKDDADIRLIELLLMHGASPLTNGCETLIDATQSLSADVLAVLLESEIPHKDISWAFQQAFTPETADKWLSEQGFRVATMLLEKGAEGESLSVALSTAIDFYGTDKDAIARQFGGLLLERNADVSYQNGLVVQKAAQRADSELIQQVLHQNPDSRAVSVAFPYIFDAALSEDDTLTLMALFTEYHHVEERLDVMFVHPGSEPVVFKALNEFPRSVKILQALLDAGYYHDQMTFIRVMEDIEEDEQVSLLFWALFQPQKRVSSTVIEFLIHRGAKVNYETRLSKTTPLMLAIQNRRPDLVKELILSGAEVDVTDVTGNSPMTMATKIGGDLGTSMMSSILAADPSTNDGSLHNSARELNLQALKVLLDFGHDADFPSPLHNGRSALGELCLNAAHAGPLSPLQEKSMVKAMALLIERGSDLTIQSDGKSVLLLALHSADPLPTTRAILKAGMWKHINSRDNFFTDGTYTYSASQYAARVLPPSDVQSQLLQLLKDNRAIDVYYANDGPQPEGAVNLPEELLRAERERRARMERFAKEAEEHAIAVARKKELATLENQIFKTRAELEDARARRQREEELGGIKARQAIEEQGFAAEFHRRNAERQALLTHERQLMEAGLSRARLVAEAELEMEDKKQAKMLEWDRTLGVQRVSNAKQLSAVRVQERKELERIESTSDARTVKRLTEHKKLVDTQNALASNLTNAGVNGRRQIGYITGELD